MSDKMSWQNRWKITATLTTASPLHIGGDLPVKKDIYPMADRKIKETVDVTAVVTGGKDGGQAYLPGSTIKGNLRAWMQANGCKEAVVEQIFGSRHDGKDVRLGGKAEFHDAFFVGSAPPGFGDNPPPYWDKDRLTAIAASTAIDRQTGTAVDKKLFHLEYVPKGVAFTLCITGQDLTLDEVAALAHALDQGFDVRRERPVSLGASTADGWGRFRLKDLKICRLTPAGVNKWLEKPVGAGYGIPDSHYEDVTAVVRQKGLIWGFGAETSPRLVIDLVLSFDGPFLVNDQSKSKKVLKDEHQADFNPRRNEQGEVVLPSASFRGAFRSQAERILRTIGAHACTPADPCTPIHAQGGEKSLCLACRLFGASGWRTAVEVSPFTLERCKKNDFTQEFVAIDRFTGGARDGAKFNAKAVLSPVFRGKMTIDLQRCGEDWALGLLALTLRDLCEGDITFGYGAAKGYGTCTAEARVSGQPQFDWPPAPESNLGQFVEKLHQEIARRGAGHE